MRAWAEAFLGRFGGRTDVWGTDHGSCERFVVGEHSWEELVVGHLAGDSPIGIYPLTDEHTVKWGCIDIDDGDENEARNLRAVAEALGLPTYIEPSRSKGFHVWCFADGWVSAIDMRRALLAVHQVAEAKSKEVNPKQVALPEGKVGNYVRLPYAATRAEGRQEMWGYPSVEAFLTGVETVTVGQLAHAGQYYREPQQPRRFVISRPYDGQLDQLLARLPKFVVTRFIDGPPAGSDRSAALFNLTCLALEKGLSIEEAEALVRDADERWGKYAARGDADMRIPEMLERAVEVADF